MLKNIWYLVQQWCHDNEHNDTQHNDVGQNNKKNAKRKTQNNDILF
jgi:hypothetical protein